MPGPPSTLRLATYATPAALALILLSPCAARAQTPQAARDRDARRADMEMRQRALWDLEKLKNPSQPEAKVPSRRPTYRDVEEDFEELQLRNYSLAVAAGRVGPLDYALIKKEAAEVRKRAARLKLYLSLPKTGEGQKTEKVSEVLSAEGLKSAAATLDALVNGFVWNPVFRRPDVVDLEQSSKASRDLAGIIGLSEQIRKCAEDLGKGGAKK
jgi:hypothetical protein